MIDNNILKNFISNFDREASFSVIITDIEQEQKCNKDIITLKTQTINPNLLTIIKNQSDLIDDINNAPNHSAVKNILNNYYTSATKVSQVISRDLTLESNLIFDEKENLFSTKLKGYQNTYGVSDAYKTNLSGTIKNSVVKVTSPDFPTRITFNDIRITDNQIRIKLKNEINNVELIVDNNPITGIIEDNLFTATINDIQSGIHTFEINYNIEGELITKNIEIAVTNIDKEIEIDFAKEYHEIPCVYVTIDEGHSNLYSAYTTNFKKKYSYYTPNPSLQESTEPDTTNPDSQEPIEPDTTNSGSQESDSREPIEPVSYIGYSPMNDTDSNYEIVGYTGVKIKFQNLKRRASYPKINITIIGGYYNEPDSD